MKQHGDQSWSGHRELTYAAVHRLFRRLAGPDDRLRGITRAEYADALDRAQAHQDRLLGVNRIENFRNTGRSQLSVLGPTTHSAYANPGVQREHFMADPYLRGEDNLANNTEYLHEQLRAAGTATDLPGEMRGLGAAAHALQDSYSGAHAWRAEAVYLGDPTAPVESLHIFTPSHMVGFEDGLNTHSDEFDEPPAASGSTQAAVEATYRMLRAYELGRQDPGQAELLIAQTLEPMTRASPNGVTVNLHPSREWEQERNRRLALEHGVLQPAVGPDQAARYLGAATSGPARTGGAAAARPGDHRDTGGRAAGLRGKTPGQGAGRG
ncbi:hypothetical protein FB561_4077 [Kribbella amoyensis]|uniref:Uncharacterized protein n=1 Tax=Kribbella amoyensis TaxID=996641 RepID=A0A561BVS6_9ACTN|nr:hypothetical protein [Kribbella amoyensis]TWD82927.1 hypothetical protein FB561_4077 [Kribbella amoyensis]